MLKKKLSCLYQVLTVLLNVFLTAIQWGTWSHTPLCRRGHSGSGSAWDLSSGGDEAGSCSWLSYFYRATTYTVTASQLKWLILSYSKTSPNLFSRTQGLRNTAVSTLTLSPLTPTLVRSLSVARTETQRGRNTRRIDCFL